jgi:intracellular sulfur oxidation DsrE/DsrF family protein
MSAFSKYTIGAAATLLVVGALAFSQKNTPESDLSNDKKPHRIVFQLTSPDTAAHRALTKQLNNVLVHWPTAQLEVVVHNKGIGMLLKDKTNVQPEITALKMKGVQFSACENTLKQQKLEKSQIVTESGFVPVGIAEIVTRQEEGWAYIKAGF